MHDDLIERRLRSALHADADGVPFTITAAELERRMRARGRRDGGRRMTLLLAAAVALGTLGAGLVLGGLSNRPQPSPAANASAAPSNPENSLAPGAAVLPTLDALISAEPGTVLVANAFGAGEQPATPVTDLGNPPIPESWLGLIQGGGEYRIAVACLGRIPLQVSIVPDLPNQAVDGPRFTCDGAVHGATVQVAGTASVWVRYRADASWRVVIRGELRLPPVQTADPVLPAMPDGNSELLRVEDATMDSSDPPFRATDMLLRQVGAVPARRRYDASIWCEPGPRVRLLFADTIAGTLAPAIETEIACDGLVHDLMLNLPLVNGRPVYVAAPVSTHWSLRLGEPTPPVGLADGIAGWTVNGGAGPSFHFHDTEVSFSSTVGDHGGKLMVVLECAGTARSIKLEIDRTGILGDAFEPHEARCSPAGEQTTFTVDTPATGYLVQHEAPAGAWTALTLLSQDGSPAP